MTTESRPLSTLIPLHDGWKSLLRDMKKDHADMVTEVFMECISRVQDPDLASELSEAEDLPYISEGKEQFLNSMMRDSVSDLIMKYMILSNQEKVKNLTSILYLIPDGETVLEEIKNLFNLYCYNPLWRLTQSMAEYDFSRKQWSLPEVKKFRSEIRGGYLKCWDKYSLTRYRMMHRVHVQSAKHSRTGGVSQNRVWKASQKALQALNPDSPFFNAGAYFFTLLKHNEVLISKMETIGRLFFKNEAVLTTASPATDLLSRKSIKVSVSHRTESAPELKRRATASGSESSSLTALSPPESFARALLKRDNRALVDQFFSVKSRFSEDPIFPNLFTEVSGVMPLDHSENPVTKMLDQSESGDKLSAYVQGFGQRLLSSFLSHAQIQELIPFFIEDIKQRNREDPEGALKGLAKLAKDLYKLPFNHEYYQAQLKPIALEIHQTTEQLMNQFNIKKIRQENVWNKLFSGKASKETLDVIIYELMCETARQFCMLDPRDLNKNIPKFIEEQLPPELSLEDMDAKLEDQPVFKIQSILNQFIFFLGTSILTAGNKKEVRKARSSCLRLAERMLQMPVVNLHLLMGVHLALNQIPITRLNETEIKPFKPTDQERFNKLNKLFDPSGNFNNIREEVMQGSSCSLPFLGMLNGQFEHAVQATTEEEIQLQKPVVMDLVEKLYKRQCKIKATVPFKQQHPGVFQQVYECGKGKTSEEFFEILDGLSKKKWPKK